MSASSPMSQDERRVENEYMFKRMNEEYSNSVSKVMSPPQFEVQALDFYCECSDPECLEPIQITVKQFNDVHELSNQFVIKPGHEQLDIEDIIQTQEDYSIVQKHAEFK